MHKAQKITVEVPSTLPRRAQQASGGGVTQTVRAGLELLAASRAYDQLRSMRGRVKFRHTAEQLKDDR